MLARRDRLGPKDLPQQFLLRIRLERLAPGEHLVEHHTQTEKVRAAVDAVGLAAGLLGAHVGRRPREAAARD